MKVLTLNCNWANPLRISLLSAYDVTPSMIKTNGNEVNPGINSQNILIGIHWFSHGVMPQKQIPCMYECLLRLLAPFWYGCLAMLTMNLCDV